MKVITIVFKSDLISYEEYTARDLRIYALHNHIVSRVFWAQNWLFCA